MKLFENITLIEFMPWLLGAFLVLGTLIIIVVIAIGNVKPETSAGLDSALHTLELLDAQFAAWAFFIRKG